MEVSLEVKEGLERCLQVQVPVAEVDRQVEERLAGLAQRTALKGFRPGRVPLSLIRRRFGSQVWAEVVDSVVRESFGKAVQEQQLQPVGAPQLEVKHAHEGEDLRYEAIFDVRPEIRLMEAEKLEIERPVVTISNEDVEAMISDLRRRHGSWVPVERPSKEGDRLRMDYTVRRAGEIFGEPVRGTEVLLGAGMLFPEFEDALHAAAVGDQRTVSVLVPESDPREELRGQRVECDVQISQVMELQLAPLDEKFFASLGVREGGEEAFRAQVRANMEKEIEWLRGRFLRRQLVERYRREHSFLLPRSLVGEEERELHRSFLRSRGMAAEELQNAEPPEGKYRTLARERVAEYLLMHELVRKTGVQVEERSVQERVERLAAGATDAATFVRSCYADARRMALIRNQVAEEKTLEAVLQQVKMHDVPYSFSGMQDLMRDSKQSAPALQVA